MDIALCGHGVEWGRKTCSHSADAGVKCLHSSLGIFMYFDGRCKYYYQFYATKKFKVTLSD